MESDFDFCQTAIKEIFSDGALKEDLLANHSVRLSAANSINWGRLVPQVVHHASAYLDLAQQGVISVGEECDICIPTGNFGNILGAIYAKVIITRTFFSPFKITLSSTGKCRYPCGWGGGGGGGGTGTCTFPPPPPVPPIVTPLPRIDSYKV